MHFNPWTFLFEVLNFVVLAAVLYRILYRPLHESIDRRRASAQQAQTDADKAREQAILLQQQLQAQLNETQQQREAVLRESHAQAEAERQKRLAQTEVEVQQWHEQGRQALESERAEIWRGFQGEMTKLAVDVVERLLRESCERTLNDQLALKLIEELQELPSEKRQAVRDFWQPGDGAALEAAAELDGVLVEKLAAAAAAVVGQPVTLTPAVVPCLLGGARLRLGGHVWDASLAGQLETPSAGAKEDLTCVSASSS